MAVCLCRSRLPSITKEELTAMADMNYAQRAAFVFSRYLTDFTEALTSSCVLFYCKWYRTAAAGLDVFSLLYSQKSFSYNRPASLGFPARPNYIDSSPGG